jgi:anaerobic magnesium-protoporphyrin IX monomethyl ester cyclase
MNVFLASPNERKILTNAGDRHPLGLLYVSTALTQNGINNNVFDLNYVTEEDFINKVKSDNPDVVGLSIVSSPSFNQLKNIADKIKNHTGKIVTGGYHTSALPDSVMDFSIPVVGEGESRLVNIILGTNETFDINKYPVPDRSKLDNDYFMEIMGYKTAGMITARGCPYSCLFCGNLNKNVKFRNKDNIEEEVINLKNDGYEAIYLYNESHTLNKRHAFEVGEIMKKHNMKYRADTRANLIDEETAKMLRDTDCILISLGIESGDDKVLKAINKGECVDDYRKAIDLLYNNGINTKGYFIFGLPEQDYSSGVKSINLSKEFQKKGMIAADFYTLTPFPGSPISEFPEKYGVEIRSKNYERYLQASKNGNFPVIETRWLTSYLISDLVKRGREAWKS